MIRKQIAIGALGIFLLLFLSYLVSAHGSLYNYYDRGYGDYYNRGYNDYYDRYSYHSERESGGRYGSGYAKIVDYDKLTSSRYVGYGGWETTTNYVKTVREYPDYNNYRYGGYGNRGYYGSSYRNYYYDW
ncbi:hypothetical protein J4402_02460 [Candidatus Pacearchaeota archaeon]|nr:hypothetical protein [Candidatus Pacearchaeota archaeon]